MMTEEQKTETIRLYHIGVQLSSIAKFVGVPIGSVHRLIYKKMQLRKRNTSHSMATFSKIKELYNQGKNSKVIGETLGLSKHQIRYVMNLHGIGFRDIKNQKPSSNP